MNQRITVRITDPETNKVQVTTISATNQTVLLEKLQKAFNKCIIEVLDKVK